MNGEHDMVALNDWLDKIRNTFTEAASLLQTVRELRTEVDGLKRDLETTRSVNRTLEENLSWSRDERQRLEQQVVTLNSTATTAFQERDKAQRDASYWQGIAEQRASELQKARDDLSVASYERDEYQKENAALREFQKGVQEAMKAIVPDQPHQPQPRDPVTGHWKSPNELAQEQQAQRNEPQPVQEQPLAQTGTDPYHY